MDEKQYSKLEKHQRSKFGKYTLTDKDGITVISTNTKEKFDKLRHEYLLDTNKVYKKKFNKKAKKEANNDE